MMKKLLLILFCLPLIFSHCQQNTPQPTTINEDIYSVIEIVNSNSGTYLFQAGPVGDGDLTNIQIPSGNNSQTYTSNNYIYSHTSSTICTYPIQVVWSPDNQQTGCSDIIIKTYHNNTLVNPETFQMGYTSISPVVYCNNLVASNQFYKTININL